MDIANKNIVITGASAGIGAALALELASKVKTLILIARRKELLDKISQKIIAINSSVKVIIFPSDITDEKCQQEIIDRLEEQKITIDILINNAGVGDEKYFHESDLMKLYSIIDLNIKSVVSFTHLVLREMMQSPKGKGIVFMGSGAGIAWMPGSAVYSASKHFITGFTMNLKAELKPYGIDIVLVTPGPVDSEFDKNAGIDGGMKGGPSQNTRISSEECAADIVTQLEKNKSLILPGRKLRRLMNLYINFPWFLREKLLLSDGKKMFNQKNKKS
ncbi:SDR family NAD(P)-dependent oxidoreductase [Parapedobacter tibetensis]|uniref:SDR family NAD(P)-dependent oxidoreductase n=1 Tax=Parapedobacter tibetensis TaxID=2972951 RepID=UPI00214D7B4D|nr:SDR family NAD(P)-dependent oxidoreductase [Parapedobacter tibetensis]